MNLAIKISIKFLRTLKIWLVEWGGGLKIQNNESELFCFFLDFLVDLALCIAYIIHSVFKTPHN